MENDQFQHYGEIVTVSRYLLDGGSGHDFCLNDGSAVVMQRDRAGQSITWPTASGARDFLELACTTVGIDLPDKVTYTTPKDNIYEDTLLATNLLDDSLEEGSGISIDMPEKGIRIFWFHGSLLGNDPSKTKECGILVPDLTKLDYEEIENLLSSTAAVESKRVKKRLINRIIREIDRFTYNN